MRAGKVVAKRLGERFAKDGMGAKFLSARAGCGVLRNQFPHPGGFRRGAFPTETAVGSRFGHRVWFGAARGHPGCRGGRATRSFRSFLNFRVAS
jgi:hypothetical protein